MIQEHIRLKKMKSWADVFVAYFQRGIKRNIVPRLGIEISIAPTESIACIADIYADFCRILQKELSPHNYDLMTVYNESMDPL